MSTGPARLHPDDEALLLRLGALAQEADPVPEAVREAGRAAFLLRRLDAELAELVHDSALDTAGVRGSGDRLLSFEAGDVAVELQLTPRGDRLQLLGQLVGVPLPGAGLVVETADGQVDVAVDATGTFRLDVAVGRFRVHVTAPDRPPVTTSWVTG